MHTHAEGLGVRGGALQQPRPRPAVPVPTPSRNPEDAVQRTPVLKLPWLVATTVITGFCTERSFLLWESTKVNHSKRLVWQQ